MEHNQRRNRTYEYCLTARKMFIYFPTYLKRNINKAASIKKKQALRIEGMDAS